MVGFTQNNEVGVYPPLQRHLPHLSIFYVLEYLIVESCGVGPVWSCWLGKKEYSCILFSHANGVTDSFKVVDNKKDGFLPQSTNPILRKKDVDTVLSPLGF